MRACSLSSLTSHGVWPLQLWVNYYLNLAYPCSEFVRSSYIYIIITTLVYLYLYFVLPRVRKALSFLFFSRDNLTCVFYDVIVTLSMRRKSSSSFFFTYRFFYYHLWDSCFFRKDELFFCSSEVEVTSKNENRAALATLCICIDIAEVTMIAVINCGCLY